MFKVKALFTDLQDNNFRYNPGDEYPRVGLIPSDKRIKELSTTANRRGIVLIEEVTEEPIDEPIEAVAEPVEEVKEKKKRRSKEPEEE